MTLARQLYDIFYEGTTSFAVGGVNGNGEVAYHPEQGIPTLAQIEQHLNGETVLGAYTVLPGNYVRWMAFDVDCKDSLDTAKELAKKLSDFLDGIPHAVEFSGGKGFHVDIFFDNPVSAKEAKRLGETIRTLLKLPKTGDPHVEVFPKQGELSKAHPLGSLLRLPLGVHPKTEKPAYFVDPQNGWIELDPEKLLEQRTTLEDIEALLKEQDPKDEIVGLLVPYWSSGQRHDLALCTSGYLAHSGWTADDVHDLMDAVHEEIGTGDLQDWQRTVTDTFTKIYEGKTVIGMQGLAEVLPASVLKRLGTLATKQTASTVLQMIDRIRLGKDAAFIKVRDSAYQILNYFKENGKLVRDSNNTYWLDNKTKKLLMVAGKDWGRTMHNEFGINPQEAFGRQVMESVRFYAHRDAHEVAVYKRSYYTGKLLYLNLGGPEVYILNGNPSQRKLSYNGDNDILFLNTDDPLKVPNLHEDLSETLDVLEFLVNDLNFKTGDKVNATPAQQRELLKAFILSIFFAQTLPTRPILTILAETGSGKTTAARRILRLLEGTQADVLGIVSDKPDSLRASLVAHKVIVLDNLEKAKNAPWLTDVLNRISTGSHIEIRVLHTTNDMLRIAPDVYVIITATDMPFSEETVYTRLLPIELSPLATFKPEYQMQLELVQNMNGLWKGMLDVLDGAVAELNANTDVDAPTESRLADFTVFCARIQKASFLNGAELMEGLKNLVSRQKQVLSDNSPLIPTIEAWQRTRTDDGTKWYTIAELFAFWQRVANANRNDWRWSSPQGLSRHVGMLEPQLRQHYGMSVKDFPEGGRIVKKYHFDRPMKAM